MSVNCSHVIELGGVLTTYLAGYFKLFGFICKDKWTRSDSLYFWKFHNLAAISLFACDHSFFISRFALPSLVFTFYEFRSFCPVGSIEKRVSCVSWFWRWKHLNIRTRVFCDELLSCGCESVVRVISVMFQFPTESQFLRLNPGLHLCYASPLTHM